MKDIEHIGSVVADAAVRAARGVAKPLDDKIKAVGRSVRNLEGISRGAMDQSDATQLDVTKLREQLGGDVSSVRNRLDEYAKAFADAIEGLDAGYKLLDTKTAKADDVADLATYVGKAIGEESGARESDIESISELVLEYESQVSTELAALKANFENIEKSIANLPEVSDQVDAKLGSVSEQVTRELALRDEQIRGLESEFNEYTKVLDETLRGALDAQTEMEEVIRRLPGPIQDSVVEFKQAQELKAQELVDRFAELQASVEEKMAEADDRLKETIKEGQVGMEVMRSLQRERLTELQDGVKGDQGDPGLRGPKGDPGAMVSPEPWKVEKLYKAGATVTHRGGSWYCELTTVDEPGDGPGWTCFANGVDPSDTYVEDGILILTYANGERKEMRVSPRHLGVFVDGENYEKTDLVTWSGAQYRAKVDCPSQHPGKKLDEGVEPQWACEVKRGGRGPKGDPGDPEDAAAIVYAQLQRDILQASGQMGEYLRGLSL